MNQGIPLDEAYFGGLSPEDHAKWMVKYGPKAVQKPKFSMKKPVKAKKNIKLPLRKGV